MGVYGYGFMGVLVYGYGCIRVGDVTPLSTHRAPVLYTTLPLTRPKRAAMQTSWMCTLTEPLTDGCVTHPIFLVDWVHACVEQGLDFLCGGVYTHQ